MPIAQVQKLGLHSTSLSYSLSAANAVAAITVGFANTLAMANGDLVDVTLRGFSGESHANLVGLLGGMDAANFDATASSWTGTTATLRLGLGTAIGSDSAQQVALESGAAVKIPSLGLQQNSVGLTIAFTDTDSPANNLSATPIAQSPEVTKAVLRTTSLSYSPADSGAVCALTLGFESPVQMVVSDVIDVVLLAFTGVSKDGEILAPMLTGASSSYFDAGHSSWAQATRTLSLVVGRSIAPDIPRQVVVGTGVEITLPVTSVAHDQPTLTVGFRTLRTPSLSEAWAVLLCHPFARAALHPPLCACAHPAPRLPYHSNGICWLVGNGKVAAGILEFLQCHVPTTHVVSRPLS